MERTVKLHDPITGEELVLYSARGESNECWRADVDLAIYHVAKEYRITDEEARRRLQNSDVDHPVMYRDQAFWAE